MVVLLGSYFGKSTQISCPLCPWQCSKTKITHLSIHLLPQIVEEEEEGENLDGGKVEDFKTSRKSSSKENSIQEKVKKSEPLCLGKDGV